MKISLLTIAGGRETHLNNQVCGIVQSDKKPTEYIVVGMGEEPQLAGQFVEAAQPQTRVRTELMEVHGNALPLAEARNRAAELADSDALVFLDVDCIPSPTMLTSFARALELNKDALCMGSARYLPQGAASAGWTFGSLGDAANVHPLQPKLADEEIRRSEDYHLFWSLCFALSKETFTRIGGFDASFAGYGAEDTDFAFAARHSGVPLCFVGATSYHQYHTAYKPPLNHFGAIIANAHRFREKWGCWPMESWLAAFADLGLVTFTTETLEILRHPTVNEIESARTGTFAGV